MQVKTCLFEGCGWQALQSLRNREWAPLEIGKKRSWSKVAPSQVEVEWQSWQVVGNPEVAWLGFVVAL